MSSSYGSYGSFTHSSHKASVAASLRSPVRQRLLFDYDRKRSDNSSQFQHLSATTSSRIKARQARYSLAFPAAASLRSSFYGSTTADPWLQATTSMAASSTPAINEVHSDNRLFQLGGEYIKVTGWAPGSQLLQTRKKALLRQQSTFDSVNLKTDSLSDGTGTGIGRANIGSKQVSFDLGPEQPEVTANVAGTGGDMATAHLISSCKSGAKDEPELSRDRERPIDAKKRATLEGMRYRLSMRKQLFQKRIRVSNLSVLFGTLGIILMIFEGELCAYGHLTKNDSMSIVLRICIVIFTLVLAVMVFCYHATEIQLLTIESGADDWRVTLTWRRIVQLSVELVVCIVCPLPFTGYIHWPVLTMSEATANMLTVTEAQVPVDVLLSLPMMLRFYLLCRFMVLHSRLFRDGATRSIAALNNVAVDFKFVLKTMMTYAPLQVLLTFTVCFWLVMCYLFTICERYGPPQYVNPRYSQNRNLSAMQIDPKLFQMSIYDRHMHNFLSSLWFILITFMSIGYGDVVPLTYCGRSIAITTGIVGIGVASALVAVMTRKLELSRAEKHVNAFMADSKLAKQRKHTAACVLQQTWFIYKHSFLHPKKDEIKLRMHQRRFLAAINEFRRVKWEQRRLAEQSEELLDMTKIQGEISAAMHEFHQVQLKLLEALEDISEQIEQLNKDRKCGHQPSTIAAAAVNAHASSSLTVPVWTNDTLTANSNSVPNFICRSGSQHPPHFGSGGGGSVCGHQHYIAHQNTADSVPESVSDSVEFSDGGLRGHMLTPTGLYQQKEIAPVPIGRRTSGRERRVPAFTKTQTIDIG